MKVGDLVVRNMGGIDFKDMKGIVLGIRQVGNKTHYKIAWANKDNKLVSDRWRREEFTLIQSAK